MTIYSKLMSTNRVAERIQSHVSSFPPPIAFARSKRASIKHEPTDFREFEMRFDPTDENSQKTKKAVLTYEDGDAEMWCEWREQLDELYRLVPLTSTEQQAKAVVSLLRGKALPLQNERYHTGIHVFHFSLSMCAPCSLFLILAFRCVPLLYPMYFFNSMSHGRLRAFF